MKDAKEILEMPIDTLLAVFFNAEEKDGSFAVVSNYRETKYLRMIPDSYQRTALRLRRKYQLPFIQVSGTKIEAMIANRSNYSLAEFRHALYESILKKIFASTGSIELDREIALALFIFRGSADFTYGYYSVDLKFPTVQFLNDMYKILLSSNELIDRLNLNFREFQPQYLDGIHRNTQVRINLKWFFDNVLCSYSELNDYKFGVLKNKYDELGDTRKYSAFEDRLVVYREDVLGRSLTELEKNKLREELNLGNTGGFVGHVDGRNQKIVSFAREVFPDECVGCRNRYDISERSFKMPRNNRYYFEINHVVPFANDGKRVDVLDNLVKLCPTCHRALTPGRASEDLQREIIHNMLESRPEVKQFVISLEGDSSMAPEDYVFKSLK